MLTKMQQPGNKALRLGRRSEINRAYLISFVTQNRIRWLTDLSLARIVIRTMMDSNQETICFVVMPDHVHWLVVITTPISLSGLVKFVKGRSGYQINKILNRKGKFWQAGFHDHAVRREENLIDVARYVIANPVRAGICEKAEDYPYWDCIWIPGRG